PTDLAHVAVEVLLATLTSEDAQAGELGGGPVEVAVGVALHDCRQRKQSDADGADDFAVDCYRCFKHALDNHDHAASIRPEPCFDQRARTTTRPMRPGTCRSRRA